MGYIYKITNLINQKAYIGKTEREVEIRWKEHLRHKDSLDLPIYRAFNKYGVENFKIEVLEECPNEEIDKKEIYWIGYYNTYKDGYNCTGGGEGGIRDYSDVLPFIIKRYQNGERLDKLCREYHCNYTNIRNLMEKQNIIVDFHAGPKKVSKKIIALDLKTKEEVLEFNSISEAGRKLCKDGCNPRVVSNHISSALNKMKNRYGYYWITSDNGREKEYV